MLFTRVNSHSYASTSTNALQLAMPKQKQLLLTSLSHCAPPCSHNLKNNHSRLATLTAAAQAEASTASETEDELDVTEWVEIGKLGIAHGVKGELKVQPFTDFPEQRLGSPGRRYLLPPQTKGRPRKDMQPIPVQLLRGRPIIFKGHQLWLIKLEGYDTPEAAEQLRNYTLLIRDEDRDPDEDLQDDDEFYVQDLIGLDVVLQRTGDTIGVVLAVYDGTGTHDVLRIQLHDDALPLIQPAEASDEEDADAATLAKAHELSKKGSKPQARTVLMPFVGEMVPEIDLEEARMVIDPPEGLLEGTLSSGRKQASPAKRRRAAARRQQRDAAAQRAARKAEIAVARGN